MKPMDSGRNKKTGTAILENFNNNFKVVIAKSKYEKDLIFKLRYEVYCLEFEYENPINSPNGKESDKYDDHSIHCMILHRRTGIIAGCMRLVIPKEDAECLSIPMLEFCADSLNHPTIHPEKLKKEKICEISRLTIARNFRTKKNVLETNKEPCITFTEDEKCAFPLILPGLFLCTFALVGITKRHDVFAMMEPRLPRLLSRSGFHFTKTGETINFHGARGAFYIDHPQAETEVNEELIPLYHNIKRQIFMQLNSLPIMEKTAETQT